MNSYEQKQERRRQRLENAADRAKGESQSRFDAARKSIEHIPFGQPILVGHHSERRHRNDLKKHDRNMRAAIDADERAKELARRAESVGSGGISSDDPEAVQKLKAELAKREGQQIWMTTLNAAWRKAGKPKADDADGWAKVAANIGTDAADARIASIRVSQARDFLDRAPYSYELTNNNGNIKRIRDRIAYLERAATRETSERSVGDVKVVLNADLNRLQLIFPGKPSAAVRDVLKRNGFRWSPMESAWQRHLGDHSSQLADRVLAEVSAADGKTES